MFTSPKSSWYTVTANAFWDNASMSDGNLFIYKNGTVHRRLFAVAGSTATRTFLGTKEIYLSAGDTLSIWAAQNSGGSKNLQANAAGNSGNAQVSIKEHK